MSDFAILIMCPDDKIVKRNETGFSPRDNVVFELGLFMGMLGRLRSFCLSVIDKTKLIPEEAVIPTDLSGFNRIPITIENNEEKNNEQIKQYYQNLYRKDYSHSLFFFIFVATHIQRTLSTYSITLKESIILSIVGK